VSCSSIAFWAEHLPPSRKNMRWDEILQVQQQSAGAVHRRHALAPGLTACSAHEKFAAVQMIDVHLLTTDGREIVLTRYT
jgi:hypothetical protein